jgi:hypothetical protein
MKITCIPKIFKPSEVSDIDLTEVVCCIRDGVFRGRDLIGITRQIQSWTDHDKQNELKFWNLPVVLFNGVFSYKHKDCLTQYSSVTAMDFDRFASEEELQRIGYWLTQTEYVLAVFRTPSGKGLKAIVLHDNDDPLLHEELYAQLLSLFKIEATDNSVSDLSRGNYLCYDPDVWVNKDCKPYHFVHNPSYIPKPQKPKNKNVGAEPDDMRRLKVMLSMKMIVGNKSDESIINILDAHWRKDYSRWRVGNRANSVFMAGSELCNAGVYYDKALEYLLRAYSAVGLEKDEIVYQTQRAYQNNAENYGSTRRRFDRYGKKGHR